MVLLGKKKKKKAKLLLSAFDNLQNHLRIQKRIFRRSRNQPLFFKNMYEPRAPCTRLLCSPQCGPGRSVSVQPSAGLWQTSQGTWVGKEASFQWTGEALGGREYKRFGCPCENLFPLSVLDWLDWLKFPQQWEWIQEKMRVRMLFPRWIKEGTWCWGMRCDESGKWSAERRHSCRHLRRQFLDLVILWRHYCCYFKMRKLGRRDMHGPQHSGEGLSACLVIVVTILMVPVVKEPCVQSLRHELVL